MSLVNARIVTAATPEELDAAIAQDAAAAIVADLLVKPEVHIAVSGGSFAERTLPAIVAAADSMGVEWDRVHVWFADERFVAADDAERTELVVARALREADGFRDEQLHAVAAVGEVPDVESAAEAYAAKLVDLVSGGDAAIVPPLDLVFLGMGPDGHTASLFPGHDAVLVSDRYVASVDDSPKPPPQRVTLTYPVFGASTRSWLCVTGEAKREALARARAEVDANESPVSAVSARDEVAIYADAAALGE